MSILKCRFSISTTLVFLSGKILYNLIKERNIFSKDRICMLKNGKNGKPAAKNVVVYRDFYFLFFNLLSHFVARNVPRLWKIWTMIIRNMTAKIIMRVWYL